MIWVKRHLRLTFVGLFLFLVCYMVYERVFGARKIKHSDRYISLLKQDLARFGAQNQTENPVVLNFRRKNSEKPGGLTIINNKQYVIPRNASYADVENEFFRYVEDKDVLCANDVRLGAQHDGGWNVCMSPPFKLKHPCLVYSFGIRKTEYNRTDKIHFKPYGLGSRRDMKTTDSSWTYKTLYQHLKDESHLKSTIDYLKFDIEYKEWDVIPNLIQDNVLSNVKQIGFEFHLQVPPLTVDWDQGVSEMDFIEKLKILDSLYEVGFRKFNYRLNPFCMYKSVVTEKSRSKCYEMHFVNLDFIETKHLEKDSFTHEQGDVR
ncbi:hypothetical protein ACF0H5_024398 [Mactra antiquata]